MSSDHDAPSPPLDSEHLRYVLGLKLRSLRQEKGKPLKAIAARSGLSVSYLSEIEKGKEVPEAGEVDRPRAGAGRSLRLPRLSPGGRRVEPREGGLLLEPPARVPLRPLRHPAGGPLRSRDAGPRQGRRAPADVPGSGPALRRARRAFPARGAALLPADARELLRRPGRSRGLLPARPRLVRTQAPRVLAPARDPRARARVRRRREDAARPSRSQELPLGLRGRRAPAAPDQRAPDALPEGISSWRGRSATGSSA